MAIAPATKHAPLRPTEPQTFADERDRARLGEVALKAYRNLSIHWGLSNAESARLLGVSESSWDRIKGGKDMLLSQDQMTRVSVLVGIYKGLHLLFADGMADRWVRLPNKGPMFDRQTPIQAMIENGIPFMLEVRRYIDAVRGGL
jgi:uncharacterized protein (DUF2384 family)